MARVRERRQVQRQARQANGKRDSRYMIKVMSYEVKQVRFPGFASVEVLINNTRL
jgi:hypothetical protein